MSETIIQKSSKDMYIEDMVKYSIIVNRRRAFPEIKDGLKPAQRRALYAMFDLNVISHLSKSARVVGETIGKYAPHGDSSSYSAITGMIVWWKNKIPLVTGHGNFGTVMGDGPASQRYTEVRLSNFCFDAIVSDLKEAKYSVDWMNNFDRTTTEPEFFPSKVPLLLINGSFGIGVGIQSNIPPYNSIEVIEATRELIKNPNAEIILIPDHYQALDIFEADWKKISETGYGSYKVRGKISIEEDKHGFTHIHVLSLPDNISTEKVVEKLFKLIEEKQLPMIKDVNDASKESVDIVITLKKGADPNYVIETLYNKCRVQDTVSVNFEVVDGVDPKRMGIKEYLLNFLDFRATTKFRLYCNKYKEVSTRLHKLDAYIKLIESGEIEKVVDMIRKQKTTDQTELEEYLIKKLHITDLQAGYILSTNIKQLSYGYLTKYKEEFKELKKLEPIYKKAITDNGDLIMKEIDQELLDIEKRYGQPRICNVISSSELNNIPKGTFKIIVTESNRIRKLPDTEKINVVKGDQPKFVLRAENTEAILLFDNKGKVFKLPVHRIPITDKQGTGTDVRILSKNLTADIIGLYYEPQLKMIVESKIKHFLVVVSKNNIIKKLDLDDFLNVNLSGLIYSKVRDDDVITGLSLCPHNLDVVVYSNQKALRMPLNDIPLLKRNAQGNKAMNTNNPIEGLSVIYPDVSSIVVLTNNGKVNKFPISTFAVHGRGKAGNNVIKLDSNDEIRSIYGVRETDKIKVITTDGVVEIFVSDIKSRSGIAAGEKAFSSRSTILHTELIYQ